MYFNDDEIRRNAKMLPQDICLMLHKTSSMNSNAPE